MKMKPSPPSFFLKYQFLLVPLRSQASQKTAAVRKPLCVERFFWVSFSLVRFFLTRKRKEHPRRSGQYKPLIKGSTRPGKKPGLPKNGSRAHAPVRGAFFLVSFSLLPFFLTRKRKEHPRRSLRHRQQSHL